MNTHEQRLLNVGCGRCFHLAWRNVDLTSTDPAVLAHDLRTGIPFDDENFDGVYHSHVLEHMDVEDARKLLGECRRVLRAGGVLRVVVPDLEAIARAYLKTLERAVKGEPGSEHDHRWMQFEMIDQLVRTESGGQMGRWIAAGDMPNPEFVARRMGGEMMNCFSPQAGDANPVARQPKRRKSIGAKLVREVKRSVQKATRGMAQRIVRRVYGPDAESMLAEAAFRRSGEIHRWMYDRVSLARLLTECGFEQVTVTTAFESRIESFSEYQLDTQGDQIRKPDSLFMEAIRPAAAQSRAA